MLTKAVDLANRLMPAFDTPSGIPLSWVNLHRVRRQAFASGETGSQFRPTSARANLKSAKCPRSRWSRAHGCQASVCAMSVGGLHSCHDRSSGVQQSVGYPAALHPCACEQLRADSGLASAQGVLPKELRQTCTACATTLLLEFGTLSRLTGDPTYERAASHAVCYLT